MPAAAEEKPVWSASYRSRLGVEFANPLLAKLSHFAGFHPDCAPVLERLFCRFRTAPRRHDIIPDRSHAGEVMLMLQGWAARYKITRDGERRILSFLLPGDVFPIHILPVGTMDYGVTALTPCRLACTSAEAFESAVLQDPRLARAFWWLSIQDKSILRAWLMNLGGRDAYSRLAHLICETGTRLRMAGQVNGPSFYFPVTQDEIAEAQGLTAVHTNRMLQRLRKDGLIELDQKILTILDQDRLYLSADFDPAYLNPGAGARGAEPARRRKHGAAHGGISETSSSVPGGPGTTESWTIT